MSVYGIALNHAPPAWKSHGSENRLHGVRLCNFQAGGAWNWAIPCWGKVAVARGKCGLGKVANKDWREISAFAITNTTIRPKFEKLENCPVLFQTLLNTEPGRTHLRPPRQQGAPGATWSGAIAPRMADGGSSGGPHTAAAGVKCCRACTAAAPRSTDRFKLIPEGPCAKAGALPRLGFDEGLLFQRQHHMSAILTASCRDRSMKGWDNVRDMVRRRTPPRSLSPAPGGRTARDRQSHAHGVHVQA